MPTLRTESPCLPWMGASVGAHEAGPPIHGWALCVMLPQRRTVILALVAKNQPEAFQALVASDQHVPVVMSDLMPEVAEQRPIGLAHGLAPALPLGVVGLSDVDGDQAVVVARQDGRRQRRPFGRIGQKVEGEPVRIFAPVDDW